MTNITQSLKVILLAIVLSFGISYVFAWAPPTSAPTGGNDSMAPLNTSLLPQTKGGNLTLNALGITNTAATALSIAGGISFSPGSSGITFPDGTIQATAPSVGMQVFTSSGTFTVPNNVQKIKVSVVGGGGGGYNGARGGGGGGYCAKLIDVSSVTSPIAVTVGNGGPGGVLNSNGGDSSFGTYCTGKGGIRGDDVGGQGGGSIGGDINVPGSDGLPPGASGRGGDSGGGYGVGGRGGVNGPGVGYGGGGGTSTGSGSKGVVIVEW